MSSVSLLLNPWVIRGVATVVTVQGMIANILFAIISKTNTWDPRRFAVFYRLFAILNVIALLGRWSNILRVDVINGTFQILCTYGWVAFLPLPSFVIISFIAKLLTNYNLCLIPWLLMARYRFIRRRGLIKPTLTFFSVWVFFVFTAFSLRTQVLAIWMNFGSNNTIDLPSYVVKDPLLRQGCIVEPLENGDIADIFVDALRILMLPLILLMYRSTKMTLERKRSHMTQTLFLKHAQFLKNTVIYGCFEVFELFPSVIILCVTIGIPLPETFVALVTAHATSITAMTPLLQAMVPVLQNAGVRLRISKVFTMNVQSDGVPLPNSRVFAIDVPNHSLTMSA